MAIPILRAPDPNYHRPVGEWSYGLDITPPDGWGIPYRGVTTDSEYLVFSLSGDIEVSNICQIVAAEKTSKDQPEPLLPGRSRKVRVGSIEATAGLKSAARSPTFQISWPYAADAVVAVSCSAEEVTEAEARAIDTARRLRFARSVISVPFSVLPSAAGVPSDLTEIKGEQWALFGPRNGDGLRVMSSSEELDDSFQTVRSAGRAASMASDENGTSVCVPRLPPHVCATQHIDPGDGAQAAELAKAKAISLANQMKVAPSMTDHTTWFDAESALPN